MKNTPYFYQFLEPLSKELALLARELESSIFSSPRTMLTHARVFVENILINVMAYENMKEHPTITLKDRLQMLENDGILTADIRDALHNIRKAGNQASHDARMFRYSEALLSWEELYKVVKWYIEVYAPLSIKVPDYQDPSAPKEQAYDISELEVRLKTLEQLLIVSMQKETNSNSSEAEVAATTTEESITFEEPGFTKIRTISYKGETLDIPYFLRDAFLLPQRFEKSETFLIRLGAEQQARIMSELPSNLEGLYTHVKRFNEKNDEQLFNELKVFIEEEKIRRKIKLQRQGELFLFYKAEHFILTEELKQVPLTTEEFKGVPSLIKQLNEEQIYKVGQLPMELVILGKYKNVGVVNIGRFFEQLKQK
ncbi:DUF4145 domain-containing protein [Bacillus luteolus]|uniref:DUF4145 domain-containing protein n=1 Tax=Litchfieldia luteola TaxID=682179 RepID=A0ABR9QJ44_9BACI|nr:DUF4145 domain-containing protein [Cytobacillus luteolus]MBE4908484.1 DUF4145 domain-containing protein [Cytobacillus luteolus]MBP1941336.1 hypothetical protein [Cytobacillus luteolus]